MSDPVYRVRVGHPGCEPVQRETPFRAQAEVWFAQFGVQIQTRPGWCSLTEDNFLLDHRQTVAVRSWA